MLQRSTGSVYVGRAQLWVTALCLYLLYELNSNPVNC